MSNKNVLLNILQKNAEPKQTQPKETQPKQTASSGSGGGRSIASQNDAFSQALADKPSTWNPNPVENKKPKQKKNFLGLNIPDGSENVWDYDATNNIIDTSTPDNIPKNGRKLNGQSKKAESEEVRANKTGYKDPNAGKSMAGASYSQALADSKKKQEEADTNIFRQDVEEAERNRPKSPEPQYFEVDGKNMLLPTVIQENGEWKKLTDKEALERYKKTGESLGEYDTPEDAYEAIPELNVTPDDPEATLFSKPAYVLSGAAKQYGSGFANLYGTTAAGLNEAGQALGGNTNEYAGWATDPISAAMIPHENDPAYYEREKNYTDTVQAYADNMSESAAKDLENAKQGLGKLGQFGVDIATNVIQMGFDAGLAALTGGGSALLPMFLRSTGSAEQEARQAGATTWEQILSGNVSGGVEALTEGMFDGIAGIYGKGAADDIIEAAIRKLTGSDLGRSALRLVAGMAGEGTEEAVSNFLSPAIKTIYNHKDLIESYKENFSASELLYEFLVGAAVAAFGGAANIATGGNANANTKLQIADEIQTQLVDTGVEGKTASKIADIVAQAEEGKALTKSEQNLLNENSNILSEALGLTVDTNGKLAPINATPVGNTEAVGTPVTADTGNNLLNAAQSAATNRVSTEAPTNNLLASVNAEATNPMAAADDIAQQIASHTDAINQLRAAPESVERDEAIREHRNEIAMLESESRRQSEETARIQEEANRQAQEQADKTADINQEIADLENQPQSPERDNALLNLISQRDNLNKSETTYNGSAEAVNDEVSKQVQELGNTLNELLKLPQSEERDTAVQNYLSEIAKLTAQNEVNTENTTEETTSKESSQNGVEAQETPEGITTPAEQEKKLNSNVEQNTATESAAEENAGENTVEESETEAEAGAKTEEEINDQIAQERAAMDEIWDSAAEAGTELTAEQQASIDQHRQNIQNLIAERSNLQSTAPTETNSEPWVPPVGNPGSSAPKVSKTSTNSMRNTAEMNGGTQEDLYYIPKSEKESLTNAMNRADADMVGEMQSLMGKETWTGEDSDTAYTIYGRLMFDAVRTKDRTAVDQWAKVVQQHKTETARALQSTAKWARTGAAAAIAASSDIDANEYLTPGQKADLKNQVYEVAQEFDNIEQDDVDSVRDLILKLNDIRNTGTFGAENFEKILRKIDDFDYLKEFALRQIMAVPNDSTNQADIGQQLKTWQVNSQLIRLGTFFRNFFGNASFDIVDTFAQDALGFAIDSAISKIAKTGRKEVGFDKGWLSKNARQAAVDAMNRSILEVAADVDMSGEASKYGNTSNRTNKMTGGKFEQFLSRWEQLLGYSLNTSDRFFRGQIEGSYAEALAEQVESGAMTEEEANQLAQAVADYRLFQNQGVAAGISKGLHDILNIGGVGGEITNWKEGRQGGFGLGDALNPYPGVPANLAVKALEYSPLNIIKGFREVVKLARDVKAGTDVTGQQMQAAMDIARGITGVPIIMLFTALAKTKLFRNSDDEEDYDVSSENSAQGLSGVQWNLDATLRALDGEKAEWKDGDKLMKVSWLEPLNAFMSIASMIADEDSDPTVDSYIKDSLTGAFYAAMDLPVMENAQKVANTLRYADKENFWGTVGDALAQLAGDFAGGMIPAPISQTARITDNYVRDTKGDTKAQTAVNSLLNNLPWFRNQLPVKTDNFGNERLNEPNELLRAMNSFVLPGAINTFQETDVQNEVARLYETSGDVGLYPDRAGPKTLEFGKEKVDLTADEQRAYHEIAGSKAEEYVNGLINSDYYKGLTDEQKSAAIKETYSIAKDLAKADYAKSHDISYDSNTQKLLNGVDKPGTPDDRTPLKEKNIPEYVAFKTGFDDAVKSGDYNAIDKYVSNYSNLGKNLKSVISERDDDFRAVKKYSDIGVGSKSYYTYKSALADTQADLDKSGSASGNAKLMALASANIPEADKKKIILNLKDSQGKNDLGSNAVAAYKALSKYGFDTQDVSDFFNTAMNCKSINGEKYDSRGTLQPDTAAYALSQMKGLSDSQRRKIFNNLKSELKNPNPKYDNWKNYTYDSEMNWINNRSNYTYSRSKSGSKGKKSSQNQLLDILNGKSDEKPPEEKSKGKNELLSILGG